jgi:hypothetical protein
VTYGAPSDPRRRHLRVDGVFWDPGLRPGGDTDQVGQTTTWELKLVYEPAESFDDDTVPNSIR